MFENVANYDTKCHEVGWLDVIENKFGIGIFGSMTYDVGDTQY